jgi:hypothetical protein
MEIEICAKCELHPEDVSLERMLGPWVRMLFGVSEVDALRTEAVGTALDVTFVVAALWSCGKSRALMTASLTLKSMGCLSGKKYRLGMLL